MSVSDHLPSATHPGTAPEGARVLVTGASGFIGRSTWEALGVLGWTRIAAGPEPPPAAASGEFIAADLLDPAAIEAVVEQAAPTHLLHLAWYAEHGRYWNSPLNLRWSEASVRLAEAFCARGGRRIVVAGTCAEYAWDGGVCVEDRTPLRPATLYGAAKDATHRLVAAWCREQQVACAWGRIFLPYGAGEAPARLIPSLVAALRGERPLFGINAAARRDFLHVRDVASAFATLLAATPAAGDGRTAAHAEGAFNIASGEGIELAAIARGLAHRVGADPAPLLALASARPGEPVELVGDVSRLSALGWRPRVALDEGLDEAVAAARATSGGRDAAARRSDAS